MLAAEHAEFCRDVDDLLNHLVVLVDKWYPMFDVNGVICDLITDEIPDQAEVDDDRVPDPAVS